MTTEQAIALMETVCKQFDGTAFRDAIQMAIDALKEKLWNETLWHDAKTDPPKTPGLYYGAVDDTNSMLACNYRDGKWTLEWYPNQEMKIIRWAEYTALTREEEQKWLIISNENP